MRESFLTTLHSRTPREVVEALLTENVSLDLDDVACSSRWIWIAQLHDCCYSLAEHYPHNRTCIREAATTIGQAWRKAAARRDIAPVRATLDTLVQPPTSIAPAALEPLYSETRSVCDEIDRFGNHTDLQILVALLFDLIIDLAPDTATAKTAIINAADALQSTRARSEHVHGPTMMYTSRCKYPKHVRIYGAMHEVHPGWWTPR